MGQVKTSVSAAITDAGSSLGGGWYSGLGIAAPADKFSPILASTFEVIFSEVKRRRVAVDDGPLADSDSFTLTVNPVNDAPYFVTDILDNAIEDLYYSYTILVDDIDNAIEEIIINESPDWLQINDSIISGTPTVDDIGIFEKDLNIFLKVLE